MLKFLTLLCLTLRLIYNFQSVMDLDGKGRDTVSKYWEKKKIDWKEGELGLYTGDEEHRVLKSNDKTIFTYENSQLISNIPQLIITPKSSKVAKNYTLSIDNCHNCLLFDYITGRNEDNDVSCSYSQSIFTIEKTETPKDFLKDRKNFVVEGLNIRLNSDSVIIYNEDGSSKPLDAYVRGHNLSKVKVKDMFLWQDEGWYYLNLITQSEIIVFQFTSGDITFTYLLNISLDILDIITDDIVQIYIKTKERFFIFVKNGYYSFKMNGSKGIWAKSFIDSIRVGKKRVELRDINIYAHTDYYNDNVIQFQA
jgi:hypothetical protein